MRKGIFTLLLAVCAVAIGISFSMRPWHVYAQQKHSANQQIAEMKRVESERVSDIKKDAEIESAAGREKIAREAGYHQVGEQTAQ